MALADLMKRGFLTSATATFATPATGEANIGSSVATVATVAVANGKGVGISTQSVATVATVAPNDWDSKLAHPEHWRDALVLEFMEVDGMTREEAQAMAAISVQPRAPGEWLAMIAELDCLIERYCSDHRLTREARMHIMATRTKQSLASIPAALAWFRRELMT